MLSQLLEDARALRIPLLLGASVLVTAWVLGFERFDVSSDPSDGLRSLMVIWRGLGDGGRISLLTFTAVLVGQLLMNLGGSWLLSSLMTAWDGPDWDQFIKRADDAVIEYERESSLASPYRAAALAGVSAERRKRRDDALFRIALAVALVTPICALLIRGIEKPWLASGALLIPLVDYYILRFQTRLFMDKSELVAIRQGLDEIGVERRSILDADPSEFDADEHRSRIAGLKRAEGELLDQYDMLRWKYETIRFWNKWATRHLPPALPDDPTSSFPLEKGQRP